MSRPPWQIGNKHCPRCKRPLLRMMYFGFGLPPWRCPSCDSVLRFDPWRRLMTAVVAIGAVVYVILSDLPGWESGLIVVGVAGLALLWFDSIELKTAE
jgi:hypothetical protein